MTPLLRALSLVLLSAAAVWAGEHRIGIYVGPGTDSEDVAQLEAGIPAVGVTITHVDREGLKEALERLDVLVIGGGSGTKLAQGLGDEGARAVEAFVREGGGYVGVGAGAYLAARGYNAHTHALELVDARIVDPRGWRRGSGQVELTPVEGAGLPQARWAYQNGPLFAPARSHGAAPYRAQARFVTDLQAGVRGKAGRMPGADAIVRGGFGEGRAVLFSVLAHRSAGTVTALFDAVCWAAGDGPAPPAVPAGKAPSGALRVAILDDEGCIDDCVAGSFACFDAQPGRFWTRRVSGRQVGEGVLDDYDVVLLPGGSATSQHGALRKAGRERVQAFVARGGGYVGVCAGAYLAASEPTRYGLGLVAARVVDTKHWKRGEGVVELEGSPALAEITGKGEGALKMIYANGPLLEAMQVPGLPDVRPLARFTSDMAKNGAPAGMMPGKLASLTADYKAGRVILFSSHPELTKGLGEMLARAALWAGKK